MNNTEQELPESPLRSREEVTVPKPSNNECLQGYEVTIRFLSRGCIVRVGCKEIPFENIQDAMKELNEYVTNTYDTQLKWRKILG
jgi:hypothetical protein